MFDTPQYKTPGFTICPASKDEADDLARIAVMASDGQTLATWEDLRKGGQTALQVGSKRAKRNSGAFSYRNADIALQNNKVISAIISYPLRADSYATAPDDVPSYLKPLLALEARAVPSWYINILATYPAFRGQGAASGLIGEVTERARSAGFRYLSLIVGNKNPAFRLYESLGFYETAREGVVKGPFEDRDTHWVLMKKKIF
ncbi:MAG: GNAT family N-acetyltransferase [Rhodobacteraceae bacterium]|nr:GNAT family N-acetyltransferase [Paracoccaceae bacterium]